MASLGLLGIPWSSVAFWPGQEKTPGRCGRMGSRALAETGPRVIDQRRR
jgi:hypothetical protein